MIAFAYPSDTLAIPLTALFFQESVWLRQLEGVKEGLVSKMFKPKPSLLAATVTQQGQDTGHHMELQRPHTLGPTYVLSAEYLTCSNLPPHAQDTQRGLSGEHYKPLPFIRTSEFYSNVFWKYVFSVIRVPTNIQLLSLTFPYIFKPTDSFL